MLTSAFKGPKRLQASDRGLQCTNLSRCRPCSSRSCPQNDLRLKFVPSQRISPPSPIDNHSSIRVAPFQSPLFLSRGNHSIPNHPPNRPIIPPFKQPTHIDEQDDARPADHLHRPPRELGTSSPTARGSPPIQIWTRDSHRARAKTYIAGRRN